MHDLERGDVGGKAETSGVAHQLEKRHAYGAKVVDGDGRDGEGFQDAVPADGVGEADVVEGVGLEVVTVCAAVGDPEE